MTLRGVVFLAARSARSQAYAQAMACAGLAPDRTLLVGKQKAKKSGRISLPVPEGSPPNIFLPDLRKGLDETLRGAAWPFEKMEVENINDPAIEEWLIASPAKLVIYSGFGGQIVGKRLLDAGMPFLHMHGGWTPEYQGSTTIYYSLLRERRCAVTAFLLTAEIDGGPIVAQRRYPPPPSGLDIDYIYDNALRADLLVDVLKEWEKLGAFPIFASQNTDVGKMYYVIHPVLKHIALLSLGIKS